MIRIIVVAVSLILGLAASSWAEDAAEPEMARIITMNGQPARCLSPVHVQEIDGERVNVHHTGFDLEPGSHRLNGRAILDTSYCKPIHGRISQRVPDLEGEFEAGKTYYVALDHSSRNFNEWRLVIWKVEPEEPSEDQG
jgi:hypothetical protein